MQVAGLPDIGRDTATGTSRRHSDAVDAKMTARIIERALTETPPVSLGPDQTCLDVSPVTRYPRAVPCKAWAQSGIRFFELDAEIVASSSR
jgi:hypothetical protein